MSSELERENATLHRQLAYWKPLAEACQEAKEKMGQENETLKDCLRVIAAENYGPATFKARATLGKL